MDKTVDFDFGADSVVIASYPKTGTAWISYIILQILSSENDFPDKDKILKEKLDYMELVGEMNINEKLKIFKTYMYFDEIRKHPNTKFIYIYRRPEDTFASYYDFLLQFNKLPDFDLCLKEFIFGNGIFEGFFEHVHSFSKHTNSNNLLLISYESMHINTKDEALKIAKFLGEEYFERFADDEEMLIKIIEQASVDKSKSDVDDLTPRGASNNKPVDDQQLYKKGKIGDGKKLLNKEQLKYLLQLTEEKLKGTEVYSEWTK